MNYFIDPSWFYWLKVLNSVNVACIVFSVVLAFAACVLIISGLINYDCGKKFHDEEDLQSGKRSLRIALILGIIFIFTVLASIFIPNKETLIEMQIARYATKENVNVTIESLKSVVDYIVESIGSLK